MDWPCKGIDQDFCKESFEGERKDISVKLLTFSLMWFMYGVFGAKASGA
jgi:hypothetical protein